MKCLKNYLTGEVFYDFLYGKVSKQALESNDVNICNGASMTIYGLETEPRKGTDAVDGFTGVDQQVLDETLDFIEEHCEHAKMDDARTASRLREVEAAMRATGTFELTSSELDFAAKLAWRNAPRCPGRIQWQNLMLRDFRHVYDVNSAFEALLGHIEYSTNGGNIRPAITVFPQRRPGQARDAIRIWNKFLIGYAGYVEEDGKVTGDPGNVKFTKLCLALGWKSAGTAHDILPLVLSDSSGEPVVFDIPDELVLRVRIAHPRYPEVSSLGLEWYALPAVSGMSLSAGGVVFPGTAFSGWYSLTEVAVRNFLDTQRYDLAEKMSEIIGLDPNSTFSKDLVATELNAAVLHSFNAANVTMVDHHAQSRQFMDFFRGEHKSRGGCPADWVWICPPVSASLTEVFHQEMLNYLIKPCYNYQRPLRYHPKDYTKVTLRGMVKAMAFTGFMMRMFLKKRRKVMIYYATETGTARRMAKDLQSILAGGFNVVVANLRDLSLLDVRKDLRDKEISMSLFLVSTFGSGASPADVEKFAEELGNAAKWRTENVKTLGKYAVFALGSSSYPDTFCAFGELVDETLMRLGGDRILPMTPGDEAASGGGQAAAFKGWANKVAKTLGVTARKRSVAVRWEKAAKADSDIDNYVKLHDKAVHESALVCKRHLNERTLLLTLEMEFAADADVHPGDHVAIMPRNSEDVVSRVMQRFSAELEHNKQPGYLVDGETGPVATPSEQLLKFYDTEGAADEDFAQIFKAPFDAEDAAGVRPSKAEVFLESVNEESLVDFKTLLCSLGPLRPRLYSLANDPRVFQDGDRKRMLVDLVVSLAVIDGASGRLGVCSRFLEEDLGRVDTVHTYLQPSRVFDVALSPEVPVVMVANGSGIAPFRSIWQRRQSLGCPAEDTLLYYGCRDAADNLFVAEEGHSHVRRTAFSRQPRMRRQYVQQLLKQEGAAEVLHVLLTRGGAMLVCGSGGMAKGVKAVMLELLVERLGSEEEARNMLARLQKEKRYQEEIFG